MTLHFEINDVVEAIDEQAPFEVPARILWIDRADDWVMLFSLAAIAKQPWVMHMSELRELFDSRTVRRANFRSPEFMRVLEEDLTVRDKSLRDENWSRIEPLVGAARVGEIYQRGAMGAMIAAHAKATGLERKTIYRLLYRFWRFGQSRNALLPNFIASGIAESPRTYVNGKPPGRPRRYRGVPVENPTMALSEQDKAVIKIGYALYKSNKTKSISDAYTKMLRRFYCQEQVHPGIRDDDVTLKPIHELPTKRQFGYWGKKAFDEITVLRSRKGERNWQKDFRGLRGRAQDGLHGPCHRFEIDATIADIYLLSRFNRNWIIGRPVVYVVVDAFSGMITGLSVGLEGPSWNGARHALFNTFTDKVDFCAAHGVTIKPSHWPCHHLPQEALADRGEMLGVAAEGLVSGLKIDLGICPPFRPDWKSIVESRFRILNDVSQIHWIPGAVQARIRERGERDYRLDATLNLAEFTQIIIESVIQYNHHSRQPLRLNSAMIAQDIEPTPINIWNWGMEHGLGEPNIQPKELVYLHLLPRDKGTIQAGGIGFRGMLYSCPEGVDGEWFSGARHKGRVPVNVWFDIDTDYIWIQDRDKNFIQCALRDSESKYRGRRFDEVSDMLAIVNQPSPEHEYEALNGKVQLDAKIEAIVASAAQDKKDTLMPASAAKQVGNIRDNRALDKIAERAIAAQNSPVTKVAPLVAKKMDDGSMTQSYAGERSAQVINLLGRLRQKGSKSP